MKIIQKSSKKALLISAGIGILLLAGGLSYYVFAMNGNLFGWQLRPDTTTQSTTDSDDDAIDMSPPTNDQQQTGSSTKEEAVNKETEAKNDDNTQASNLDVSFTTVSQADNVLRVRAKVQKLVSGGTCNLTLTKGSSTVTKTAPTYAAASISTCQGFDVPVSELSPGTWQLSLTVRTKTASGKASTSTQIN